MKLFGGNAKKNIEAILGDFRTKYILPVASLIVIISCFVYTFFTGANDPTPTSPSYGYSDSDNDQNNDMDISDNCKLVDDINSSIREYEIAKMNKIKQKLMKLYNAGDKISYLNMSKAFLVNSVANELYESPIAKSFDNEMDCGVITIDNIDSFSREEIIDYICDKYGLTDFEFKVIASTVYYETFANNYDDAYRVINTIYNRTKSKNWVNYISCITDKDGSSMYAQVIAPGQFDGCRSNSGYDYDELLETTIYDGTKPFETTLDAIFDFMVSENSVHNFLSFKGLYWNIDESEKMQEGFGITNWVRYTDLGNIYHNPLTESDLIDENYSLVPNSQTVLTRKRG